MFQQTTIIGNLGGTPDMKYLNNGKAVTNFSVATSENWTDQNGEKHEKTTWWRVAVFGKSAEACNNFLSKGSRVMVQGRVNATPEGNPRIWQDASGNSRASFELNADTVKFLTPKGGGNGGESQVEEEESLPF
jgi:single-strand DNA-binding protein